MPSVEKNPASLAAVMPKLVAVRVAAYPLTTTGQMPPFIPMAIP
jgi:hypothetical protein